MSDYLWDCSGPPDPEVERLEGLLGRFRMAEQTFELPASETVSAPVALPARSRLWRWAWASAAVAALAVFAFWLGNRYFAARSGWKLTQVAGTPRIGAQILRTGDRIQPGQTLEIGPAAQVILAVDGLGHVELGPETRVTLLEDARSRQQLRLSYGTLHADITAPPYVFLVLTPSAYALDMGCAYTLIVHRDGSGLIHVTAGWVEFQHGYNQTMVPAGAVAETQPGIGPGAPFFADASPAFRSALSIVNFDRSDPARRTAALSELLAAARKKDAFTLLNLFRRVDPGDRGRVYDRLAELLPPPAGVSRQAVVDGDWSVLNPWWDKLGLGSPKKGKKRPPVIQE
jgi:ferric-dicitrate binding protein FerR (iron transport regulator)